MSMCSISNGGKQGREQELLASAKVLGLSPAAVQTLNRPELQDGGCWEEEHILKALAEAFPDQRPDVMITFDEAGATEHPNHMSLMRPVICFAGSDPLRPIKVYALKTKKRISLLAAGASIARALVKGGKQDVEFADELLFLNGLSQYLRVVRATNQHKSQRLGMLTRRWVIMNLSRYLAINKLQLRPQRLSAGEV
jgi:LmbE family N-acetylglucosaminyl deacetylase